MASIDAWDLESSSEILTVEDGLMFITIVHPNETAVWTTGKTETISWEQQNLNGNVSFQLFLEGTPLRNMGEADASKGEMAWLVPLETTRSLNYQIRVHSVQNPSVVYLTK